MLGRSDARWIDALIKTKNVMETMMKTYEFSIIASGLDPKADDFEGRFYDHGCSDALVSYQKGSIIVDFAREATSLEDAIASAFADVTATGATVKRIEPDPLVSLSDMALRSGLSKSAISLYVHGKRGSGFPGPTARVMSESPFWSWAAVARWMANQAKLTSSAAIEAEVFSFANALIDREVYQSEEFSSRLHEHSRKYRDCETTEPCA